jgi:hypothetical protein
MRLAVAALVIAAGSTASAARADTGTYHRCMIEGEPPAEVYMDASGREVTFDVRGEHREIRAMQIPTKPAKYSDFKPASIPI